MSNVKITGLGPVSTPLTGNELLEVVQSGVSVKATAANIAATYAGTLSVAKGGTGAITLTSGHYLKGNGTSAITSTATIPYADLSGRAYLSAYSAIDQTGSTSAATSVIIGTTSISQGISMTNNGSGNATRVTFTDAGTYAIMPSVQVVNSDGSDHDVTFWFRKNGTDIASSATVLTVPKATDGGKTFFQIVFYEQVTAGQYVELMWLPENTAVTLDYIAAGAIAPAAPSVIMCAERIA